VDCVVAPFDALDLFLNLPNTPPARRDEGRRPPLSDSTAVSPSFSTGVAAAFVSRVSLFSTGSISLLAGGSNVVVDVATARVVASVLPLLLEREFNLPEKRDDRSRKLRRGATAFVVCVDVAVLLDAVETFSDVSDGGSGVLATVVRLREPLTRLFKRPRPRRPLLDCVTFVVLGATVVVVASVGLIVVVALSDSSTSPTVSITISFSSSLVFLFCFRLPRSLEKSLPLPLDAVVVAILAGGFSVVLAPRFLKLGLSRWNLLPLLPFVV